jgi:hypothetical protein
LKTSKSSSQSVEELLEKFSWEEESKKMNLKLKKICWTVDFVPEIQCSHLNSSNHVRGLRESKKLVILLHAQKLSCWNKNYKVMQWLENRDSESHYYVRVIKINMYNLLNLDQAGYKRGICILQKYNNIVETKFIIFFTDVMIATDRFTRSRWWRNLNLWRRTW